MRAITYDRFGPAADVLKLTNLPTPAPAPGEVLVRLATSGVNPSDVKVRAGGRPGVTKPAFPQIIPHSDGAGTIEAVGEGVAPSRIGQRVWVWNGQWQRAFGTAAEYVTLPASQAIPLPNTVDFVTGATLGIPGMTACHAVLGSGDVAGKTVLVSGAAGTVGHLAVQIAAASGARVLATARGEEGIKLAKDAGADAAFDFTAPDLAAQILDATSGTLVDRIIEGEFGANPATNSAVVAEGGTIVGYGSAHNMTPELPFYPLMFKAVRLDLILIYLLDVASRSRAIDALHALLEQQAVKVRISNVFPLNECADAQDTVAQGARSGSVVIDVTR